VDDPSGTEQRAFQLFGKSTGASETPTIRSLEEWFDLAGPQGGRDQWVPLRSAFELARAWCPENAGAMAPAGFLTMLTDHPLLEGLELREGFAEHETPLRGEHRGPRVHDLLLIGTCSEGRVVIGVEGKADEAFDRPLKKRWAEAQATLARGKATNWPARLERLARALLGVEATSAKDELNAEIEEIPFQLLSALAGTLIETEERDAQLAVLVAHVFTSTATRPELVEQNRASFANFVGRLGDVQESDVEDGKLYGPFLVPGGEGTRIPSHIPVLIGELTTRLETAAPSSESA
jgi:hypothetical protein